MNKEDVILVSVDDHTIEPKGAFTRHMPEKYKGREPHVESIKGRDVWVFEENATGYMGLNAVVGRPKEEYGMEPLGYEHMRKGTWNIQDRIDDMNANGVVGSLSFPTFPGFAGQRFQNLKDKAVSMAAIQAYNDWHLEEWCGHTPGRFIPLIIIPWWDANLAAIEIERMAKLGVHALTMSDNPSFHGFPSIHNDHWDPIWKACADNKVVICCHIGTGRQPAHASDETPIDAWITSMPISISNAAADWLWAPMWKKFPDLRMALSEGGIGWVPYFLERADFTHNHHQYWTNSNFGNQMPSDVFNKHFITCFIEDKFGLQNTDSLNMDMVTWESDYPHSDCTWPHSADVFWDQAKHLPDELINKISHQNAMREFSYDPISLLGRDKCTVAGLRAQAGHVDTSPTMGMGGAAPVREQGKPVTSGNINDMFESADAGTAL